MQGGGRWLAWPALDIVAWKTCTCNWVMLGLGWGRKLRLRLGTRSSAGSSSTSWRFCRRTCRRFDCCYHCLGWAREKWVLRDQSRPKLDSSFLSCHWESFSLINICKLGHSPSTLIAGRRACLLVNSRSTVCKDDLINAQSGKKKASRKKDWLPNKIAALI